MALRALSRSSACLVRAARSSVALPAQQAPQSLLLASQIRAISTTAPTNSFYARKKKMIRRAQEKEAEGIARPARESEMPQELKEMRLIKQSPGVIADDWVPIPEDKQAPLLSAEGAKERVNSMKKKTLSTVSVGLIKKLVGEFNPFDFAVDAQKQFIEMQSALVKDDKEKLRELVTDDAYLALRKEFRDKKQIWEFVSTVERPQVVHVMAFPVSDKKNYFAQVTVKLHLTQKLAVFDRLGQLKLGSTTEEKDVVDYVVFERHIAVGKDKSQWKICGKIIPKWMRPSDGKAAQDDSK